MDIPASVQATAYLAAAGRAGIDPYARLFVDRLGPAQLDLAARGSGEVVARTHLMDLMLLALVGEHPGLTLVNVGAGLCARPYRLDLSPCREVIEIDAPAVLSLKDDLLGEFEASCPVRRIPGTVTALPPLTSPVAVLTEGVLVYLRPAELADVARSLAGLGSRVDWLADIVCADSAAAMAAMATQAGSPLPLSGLESLDVFEESGWTVLDYRPLPVARPSRPGRSSRDIVDGVLHLRGVSDY